MIDEKRYEEIIASIVGVATFKVSGVASLSGAPETEDGGKTKRSDSVVVMIDQDSVKIDVCVNAFSGVSVPDLAYELQKVVAFEVEKATKFKVKAVNVYVNGIVFNQ